MRNKHFIQIPIALSGLALATSAFANQNQEAFSDSMNDYCEERVIVPSEGPVFEGPTVGLNFATRAATDQEISTECTQYTFGSASDDYVAQATPDEAPALYTSLVQLSADQIGNVSQHLTNQRNRARSESDQTAQYPALNSYYGGAASSDLFSSGRFSIFLNGAFVDGEQDATDYEVGYELTTDHYTLGVDYRISNELLVGFAYGASSTDLEYNQFGDTSENDTDHYILYGSWYRDNFAVDATLGFASGEFETLRHMPDDELARGETDNDMTYFSVAGSYDFSQGGWSYGPKASLDWLDGEIDAFAESDESVWAASFEKQEVESLILAMGGYASYAASFNWGVLIPHGRAEWRHEFEDDRALIVGSFVNDQASQFSIAADDPDSSWFQASVGVSAVFAHGISVFLDYEEILGYNDTDLAIVSGGARFEF